MAQPYGTAVILLLLVVIGALVTARAQGDSGDETRCISDTAEIFQLELSVLDTSTQRNYTLCPDTIFDIRSVDRGNVPFVLRPNFWLRCGVDGSSANNCTLRGGDVQMVLLEIDKIPSLAPFDLKSEFLDNVLIQGITFEQTQVTSVIVGSPGDFVFRDCIFRDMEASGSIVTVIDYDELISRTTIEDTVVPSQTPSLGPSMSSSSPTASMTGGPTVLTSGPTVTNSFAPTTSLTTGPTISAAGTFGPTGTQAPTTTSMTASPTLVTLSPTANATGFGTMEPTFFERRDLFASYHRRLGQTLGQVFGRTLDRSTTGRKTSPSSNSETEEDEHRLLQRSQRIEINFDACQFVDNVVETDGGVGVIVSFFETEAVGLRAAIRRSVFSNNVLVDSCDDDVAFTTLISNVGGTLNLRSNCFLDNSALAMVANANGTIDMITNNYIENNNVTSTCSDGIIEIASGGLKATDDPKELENFTCVSLVDEDVDSPATCDVLTPEPSSLPTVSPTFFPTTELPTMGPSADPSTMPSTDTLAPTESLAPSQTDPPLIETPAPSVAIKESEFPSSVPTRAPVVLSSPTLLPTTSPETTTPTISPETKSPTSAPTAPRNDGTARSVEEDDDGGGGLNTGAIVGIILACVIVAFAVAILIYLRPWG